MAHSEQPAMSIAFPIAYFDALGVLDVHWSILNPAEPPDADPHVRWCGRGGEVTLPLSRSCA